MGVLTLVRIFNFEEIKKKERAKNLIRPIELTTNTLTESTFKFRFKIEKVEGKELGKRDINMENPPFSLCSDIVYFGKLLYKFDNNRNVDFCPFCLYFNSLFFSENYW